MRDHEISILIDALRPYCLDLSEKELSEAAERFLDYLDLSMDFYERRCSDTTLTEGVCDGTVEENQSIRPPTIIALP
jgi:hypothetical protein